MAGAACGIQLMLAALLNQSFGAYVAVLSDERGWSKTALSGAAALQSVESALVGPVLGYLLDRFGPQGMIRLGIGIFALGFIGLSQIDSLGGFYVCAVLLAIGASLGGYFPLTVALIQWFERYRARALSLVSLGLALGGLLVPLVAWSMHHFGWRNTAMGSGFIALLVGLPLASVIRRRPQDHGETVDGLPPAPAASVGEALDGGPIRPEFTASQALRTPAFWLLAAGHAMALLVVTAVNVHAITHMKEGLGYTFATAGWVIMLMTFGQLLGVLLGAAVGDRFEKRKVAALCMLSHALGLMFLTYSSQMQGLIAFAMFHGLAWGLRGPFMQAIRADYFGRQAIGAIMGISAAIIAVGQIAGPMVAGLLADLTGDYRLGFTVLSILAALGSVSFMLAKKPVRTVLA